MSTTRILTGVRYVVWVRSSAMLAVMPEDAERWLIVETPDQPELKFVPKKTEREVISELTRKSPPGLYVILFRLVKLDVLTEEWRFREATVCSASRETFERFFGTPPELPKPLERTPVVWPKSR